MNKPGPRIAVGGLHIECSSYNPLLTREADFELVTGQALLDSHHFHVLSDYPAQFHPTIYAHALPGGPIEQAAYNKIKADLVHELEKSAPLDGVYLMMHGAAFVDGMEDAEGDLLTAVRDCIGPDVPLSVSYDLHGNVSERVIDAIDMFTAYRTAPHVDVTDTHRRALDQLFRCLDTGQRPSVCWCPIPVALPGERTSTEDQPARDLYQKLPEVSASDGIWDASLMVGYVWVDEPRMTAASVITGLQSGPMEKAARGLAMDYWNARTDFTFGTAIGSIGACLDEAAKPGKSPFVLADSGDNPTGGGVGDRVDALREVLARAFKDVVVAGIADEPATELAFEVGPGASAQFTIGGTLDPETSEPLILDADVVNLVHGASRTDRQAVLSSKGVTIVVTAKRRPFHRLSDFQVLGLKPEEAQVVIVKSGYLVPEIKALAARTMMAISPGVVDQEIQRQPRSRSGQNIFPFADVSFDPIVRWANTDPRALAQPAD